MSVQEKEIIEKFYECFYTDPDVIKQYLHPDAELTWNSSTGLRLMDFDDISALASEMSDSYDSLRMEVKDILKEENQVVINFTYHVNTIENPDEEIPMAHFMAIWKIKDNKLYKGHQFSQLAD
ncbi:nuclear transport factor 2 family protein [Salegentibacter sp. F188]|uniref:Nuclear transport factor 2 family protein n=1 Tax=Autumnicola patrickiae TaxID=3075591 RepID=A0ABU3E3L1_9FLAO|nr:nuclear transport factor 2 family protein [Salegentibacter sp. F188]MDT0690512.1 nuclear transport factor 2 family protein [Salegentibacter sp. F188]